MWSLRLPLSCLVLLILTLAVGSIPLHATETEVGSTDADQGVDMVWAELSDRLQVQEQELLFVEAGPSTPVRSTSGPAKAKKAKTSTTHPVGSPAATVPNLPNKLVSPFAHIPSAEFNKRLVHRIPRHQASRAKPPVPLPPISAGLGRGGNKHRFLAVDHVAGDVLSMETNPTGAGHTAGLTLGGAGGSDTHAGTKGGEGAGGSDTHAGTKGGDGAGGSNTHAGTKGGDGSAAGTLAVSSGTNVRLGEEFDPNPTNGVLMGRSPVNTGTVADNFKGTYFFKGVQLTAATVQAKLVANGAAASDVSAAFTNVLSKLDSVGSGITMVFDQGTCGSCWSDYDAMSWVGVRD